MKNKYFLLLLLYTSLLLFSFSLTSDFCFRESEKFSWKTNFYTRSCHVQYILIIKNHGDNSLWGMEGGRRGRGEEMELTFVDSVL